MEKESDLCLVLGTSLSGMNADRVAKGPAKRALTGDGSGFRFQKRLTCTGIVLINLQQTPLDSIATVRIWAKLDDAFRGLIKYLDLDESTMCTPPALTFGCNDIYEVPYNSEGQLDLNSKLQLNLQTGQKVKIPNKESMNFGVVGEVCGKDSQGNYIITYPPDPYDNSRLGLWMLEAAQRGALSVLPVINV